VIWLLPLAVSLVGLVTLAVLAAVVRREVRPTLVAIDRFGREHRVALEGARERLVDGTTATRRRLPPD
jgi:hypothetical protein